MGFYKTEFCFFTNNPVISCDETDDKLHDAYYYRIKYKSKIREFILSKDDDWQNDSWLKENGQEFLELIDKNNEWNFFDNGLYLLDIKSKYNKLTNR